jgi:ketosteroid isomerase-like protein
MRIAALLTAAAIVAAPLNAQARAPTPPPAPAPLPSTALPPALERVLRDYERAWRAGDATALAALFTPDGFVPTRFGWARGTAAIQATYGNAGGALRLRAHGFATADSVGYIVGAFGYGEAADTPDRGKFVLALRRGPDGRWLIAADLDAGSRP